jgi:hypothetical protein
MHAPDLFCYGVVVEERQSMRRHSIWRHFRWHWTFERCWPTREIRRREEFKFCATTAEEKFALLNCRRLPGRVNTSEAKLLLGFQEHDIAPLVAAKLVVPLGKPAPNAPKYFAAMDIADRASDSNWLSGATKELAKHWFRKKSMKASACEIGCSIRCSKTGKRLEEESTSDR